MKLNRRFYQICSIVFCITFSFNTTSNAQPEANPIITGIPFLRIIPDARSAAMGDAAIALSPDANSMHANSSKLAFIPENGGFALNYTPWLTSLALSDVFLSSVSGFYSPNDKQTIGASIKYFSLGKIDFTDINGEPLGSGEPREFEIALSYNRKLTDKFAMGITPKLIHSNLASGQTLGPIEISPARAVAVDISGFYTTELTMGNQNANLRIGGALSNLGNKITYTNSNENRDYLPANLGLGAAIDVPINEFNALTFAFDVNKLLVPTPDPNTDYKNYSSFEGALKSFGDAPGGFSEELHELSYSLGIEYLYNQQFALRAGYYSEHETKGGRKYFTLGLGFKYSILGINLSYLVPKTNQRNPLDNTLRFSLIFAFGDKNIEE